jgi:hypothetical protein
MICAHSVTIGGALVGLLCAISFLVIGIVFVAFPRRIQNSDTKKYEKLPDFFKFFRTSDYIGSRRFIWVTRAWGLLAIAVGMIAILDILWWLFVPKS